jgi:hypothetical protein
MFCVVHRDLTSFTFVSCKSYRISNYLLFSQYVQNNKGADNDWFRLESNKEGTKWFGKCWCIHNLLRYEFDVEFDVSAHGT